MAQRVVDERTLALQGPSTKKALANHVEPVEDLAAERRRATFDVEELSYVLAGGKDKLQRR